jgi:hypothetical protein
MKMHIVMLGFNRPETIQGAMEALVNTTLEHEKELISKRFFFCQYPLPSIEENRHKCRSLCKEYGWQFDEIPNEGVLFNHNRVIHEYLNMDDADFYFTYDPDVRLISPGWVSAFIEALQSDNNAMFCCSALDFHHHDWMQRPPYSRKVTELPSGLKIARYGCLISWASGAWKAHFLKSRPRNFGRREVLYGESEFADHKRLKEQNKTWISLVDFVDYHLGAPDQEYIQWKKDWAHGKTLKPFDLWLQEGNK